VSAAALALLGLVLWGPLAGLVILSAYGAHILADQLGFMGSNLFFPFGSRRKEGMKLTYSGEAFPNFALVWLSCLLVFWNLYGALTWELPRFNPLRLLFYGALIPWAAYVVVRRILARSDS
jgi:hypothetical protein